MIRLENLFLRNIIRECYNESMKLSVEKRELEINEEDYQFLERISGSDFVRFIGGDQVSYWRWRNLVRLAEKVRQLCAKKHLNPKQVAPKFLLNFFEGASNEDDENLQELWAKILAGEMEHPKSFSLRTLDTLKNMSTDEALLFQELSQYFLFGNNLWFIFNDDVLLSRYGINYPKLMKLEDTGLIGLQPFLSINIDLRAHEANRLIADNRSLVIFSKNNGDDNYKINFHIYALTESGKELLQVVEKNPDSRFIEDCTLRLNSMFEGVTFSLHEIIKINENEIKYKKDGLVPKPKERHNNKSS